MEPRWLTRTPGHTVCYAEEFGYRTDLPVLAATAERALTIDQDTEVELRVSPGQHQVLLTHRGEQWVETIGLFDGAAGLPVLCRLPRPTDFASDLEMGCTVTEHSARGLRKALRHMNETLDASPMALCVQDSDEPTAVTAASCHPDPESGVLMWWSWRVLPESGRVVRTRSRLQLTPQLRRVAA